VFSEAGRGKAAAAETDACSWLLMGFLASLGHAVQRESLIKTYMCLNSCIKFRVFVGEKLLAVCVRDSNSWCMKRKEFERGDQVRVIATMDSGLTNQLLTRFFTVLDNLHARTTARM